MMDPFIVELIRRKDEASQMVKALNETIRMVQATCDHPKWISAGHDSHYEYKVCDRCGHEEKC